MIEMMKTGLNLGLGVAFATKDQVEKMVNELVSKGEIKQEETNGMVQQLIQRGEAEKSGMKQLVRQQLQQMAAEMNLPTQADMTRMEQRIEALEARIARLEKEAMDRNPAVGTADSPFSDIRE